MLLHTYTHTYTPGLVLRKPPLLQDMKHEVPSIDVLHYEEEMVSGLEAGVEPCQEGWLGLQC